MIKRRNGAADHRRDDGGEIAMTYLADLAAGVPTTENINYYLKIVSEKSDLRRLIKAGIMPGCQVVRPCRHGKVKKRLELYFAVAQYVRIGRSAL